MGGSLRTTHTMQQTSGSISVVLLGWDTVRSNFHQLRRTGVGWDRFMFGDMLEASVVPVETFEFTADGLHKRTLLSPIRGQVWDLRPFRPTLSVIIPRSSLAACWVLEDFGTWTWAGTKRTFGLLRSCPFSMVDTAPRNTLRMIQRTVHWKPHSPGQW